MRRAFYIIIWALLPIVSHAQSIADLTRKAEIEKNPLHIYSNIGDYNNGLYIVRKDNDEEGTYAYGVVNNGGTVYIPVEYNRIEFTNEYGAYEDNVYKCEKNGKWGLVSSTNGTLLPCEYNSLSNKGNGIWRTFKNGKYGYVQLNRLSSITTLIPCIYESLGDYSSDSYIHATLKGKKGMIDGQNKIIIPFEYSKVGNPCHTSNGNSIVWVEKDGKLGIYNDDGKELQPCDIDKAYILTEYNSIELSYTDCPSTDYIYIVRNGLTGLISGSTFETIIPCMYEHLSPIKSNKAFYKVNGKWGIIDTSNKTIQLAIYDNVEIDGSTLSEQKMPSMAFQSNMYVLNNGKVGMLKANGEDFIPVKYDSLGMYSDNMLVAKVGDKYGFLNEEGKESVPFVYSQAHNYSEGLAAVVNENGKYLFIDKSGNVTIKPKEYDRVDNFQNGTCKVYRKDKVWEIDREGKKVKDSTKKLEEDNVHEGSDHDDIYVENTNCGNNNDTTNTLTPNIISTLNFNDKIFQHQHTRADNVMPHDKNKDKTELKYDEISDLKKQKPNGRITKIDCSRYNDKDDDIQLSQQFSQNICKYDEVLDNFSDGLLPVTKNKKLGYINAKGEEVIPCTLKYYIEPGMDDGFVIFGRFKEGLAKVCSFDGESGAEESFGAKNIKFGYMDKMGKIIIPPIYQTAGDFSEGKAYVSSETFNGFIDTTGKKLFEIKGMIDRNLEFVDGMLMTTDTDNNQYLFYNSEGKVVLKISMDKYWTLSNFHEGLAYFEHYDNINDCIDRKGFIDKNGIEVLNLTEYKIINSFSEGLAAVSKDGNKFGFINTKGEIVIPCQYEGYSTEGDMLEFNDFHDGVCLVQTQNIYINKKNEIVLRVKKGVNCSDMSKGLALINEYNSGTNISTYGIVCLNGYNTLDHQDNDLALQRIESLKVQQKIEAEKSRKEQEERDLEEKRRIEERRRIEEIQKQNSLQLGAIPNKFTSYADVFKLIYPSKKFYFNRASSIYGIDVWFKGYLEIRANKDNGTLSIFANGIKISELYNRGKNYESVDVKDKMVRLFVRDSYDDYPLIIHLSDSKENKPYIYFEPRRGTDFRGDFDIRYRNRVLWQWVEPDVGSNSAHIIFHPTSEVEPTPIRYVMK